jgi:hypothetical protein
VIRDETYWHCSQRLPGQGRRDPTSVVRRVLDEAGASYEHLNDLDELDQLAA